MKSITYLALVIFTCSVFSGNSLNGQVEIPLYEDYFSDDLDSIYQAGEIRWIRASWRYTYMGDVRKALESYQEVNEYRWGFDQFNEEDLKYLAGFQGIPAKEAILKAATDREFVLFNEAHHIPMHRHFLKRMLKDFKDLGFKYLGIEALTNCEVFGSQFPDLPCDTSMNERGYPLYSFLSGTYTREPQMSNLIREAIQLGFTVYPYEEAGATRERDQAENIKTFWEDHNDGKHLILCGFAHLLEKRDTSTAYSSGKMMGYYLKELTETDPLTINQYILTEAVDSLELPHYQYINLKEPSVLMNEEGAFYTGSPDNEFYDLLVYHPRTQYILGRPSWLWNDTSLQAVFIAPEKISIAYPILAKARYKSDLSEAVPIDIIELKDKTDQKCLLLPKGTFIINLINREGVEQVLTFEVK